MIIVAGDSNHDPKYQTERHDWPLYKGDESDPVKLWTEQVNADILNISKIGYGNDQICNAVIKAVEENNNIDHVIVLWSQWYRVLKRPLRLYNKFIKENTSVNLDKTFEEISDHTQFGGSPFYQLIFAISNENAEYITNENIKTFYTLQSFLKDRNIPYTFYQDLWPWPYLQYEQNLDTAKLITNHPLYDLIDKDNFWGWPIHPYLSGKYLGNLSVDTLSKTDSHYGQKTHDLLAKLLMKGVKQ